MTPDGTTANASSTMPTPHPPPTPKPSPPPSQPMPSSESSFTHSLARISCAQILYAQAERQQRQTPHPTKHPARGGAHSRLRPIHATSFHVTEGVMDALADIVAAFLVTVGREATRRSRFVGRRFSNLIDVLGALDALKAITHCGVKELAMYTMYQEVPFPYPVPEVPVLPAVKKRKNGSSGVYVETVDAAKAAEGPVDGHQRAARKRKFVEGWMPELPSAHTYVNTPVLMEIGEANRDLNAMDSDRRRVEKTLARLKETKGGRTNKDKADLQRMVSGAVSGNPFMAIPDVGRGVVFEDDDVQAGRGSEGSRNVVEKESEPGQVDSNVGSVMSSQKGAAYEQKRQRVERILAESGVDGTVVSAKVEPPP